jgi:hypothetical protein
MGQGLLQFLILMGPKGPKWLGVVALGLHWDILGLKPNQMVLDEVEISHGMFWIMSLGTLFYFFRPISWR